LQTPSPLWALEYTDFRAKLLLPLKIGEVHFIGVGVSLEAGYRWYTAVFVVTNLPHHLLMWPDFHSNPYSDCRLL